MRNPLFPCLAVVVFAAGAPACGSGTSTGEASGDPGGSNGSTTGGPVDNCVIDATARLIVQETVAEQVRAAHDVAKSSGDLKRGFAVQIPASKFGFVGTSVLNTECPSDVPVQKCLSKPPPPQMPPSDEFWQTRDACVRFYCEKGMNKIALVDTYMTMKPETDVTKRHKFEYPTTSPSGVAIYDPNPLITWRVDLTDPTVADVSATIDVKMKITPTDSSLFDFKHTGTVTAQSKGDSVTSVSLDLEFTGLFLAGDPPITANAALDAAGKGSGSVKNGDEVIANIDELLGFEWLGDCASPP